VSRLGESPPGEFRSYPNPFNPATTVIFSLASPARITLTVFDVLGRRMSTLAAGNFDQGTHSVRWDAGGAPGGVYVCRLEGTGLTRALKLILVR